jgi:hypothetical protein
VFEIGAVMLLWVRGQGSEVRVRASSQGSGVKGNRVAAVENLVQIILANAPLGLGLGLGTR